MRRVVWKKAERKREIPTAASSVQIPIVPVRKQRVARVSPCIATSHQISHKHETPMDLSTGASC
jgi:hypothetical protein